MVVGAVEPAPKGRQVASAIFHLSAPAVVLARLQSGRKGNLDPIALHDGSRAFGGRVCLGLRLGHRLVEIEGQFPTVGRNLGIDQLGR